MKKLGVSVDININIPSLMCTWEAAGQTLEKELKAKLDALIPDRLALCNGCGNPTPVVQLTRSFGKTTRIIANLHCRNCASPQSNAN